MTTQYTPILKLALPVQGELSGTWGDVVNDNITSMVEQAIAGRSVIDTWPANSHVLTTANGVTAESRAAMLSLTDSGTALTGAGSVICPALSKTYIVKNGTAQVITVKTAAGSGIAVPVGKTMLVYCDGTNVLEAVDHVVTLSAGTLTITGLTTFASLKGTGATTVTNILDEDNMASDSATAIATQQSIKAYVDSQVGTVDTLSEILANGNTTGANDIDVDGAQKVQFRDAAIYINSSVDGQLDIVADTEIQIAATTIDINGAIVASGDISAASLDISGNVDIDGITNLDVVDIDGAVQIDAALTVGVDDTGYDVKFYGATGGAYMLWDESADDLILAGAAGLSVAGVATLASLVATTADINAGTIDGTVIGGTTPAALSATTGSFSSTLGVTGAATFASTLKTGGGAAGNTSKLMVNTVSGTAAGIQLFQDANESWIIENTASSTNLTFANSGATRLTISGSTGAATFSAGITATTGTFSGDVNVSSTGTKIVGVESTSNGGVAVFETTFKNAGGTESKYRLGGNQQAYDVFELYDVTNTEIAFRYSNNGGWVFNDNGAASLTLAAGAATFSAGVSAKSFSGAHAAATATTDNFGGIAGLTNGYQIAADASNNIVYSWLDGAGNVDMTLDASGNVGIGNSAPEAKLSILGGSLPTASSGYSLSLSSELSATRLTTDASSRTSFIGSYYDDTSLEISQGVTAGYTSGIVLGARNATNATVSDAIAFYTRSTEHMRINSSGTVLVGTTTENVYDGTTSGVALTQSGYIFAGKSNDAPLYLNRIASDGIITNFAKDGTTVGSIGTVSGLLGIGSGDAILAFDGTANAMYPMSSQTGGASNGVLDFGSSLRRFKDLYLSGGVYLGGTGAANLLDDYEEGTWTPTLIGTTSGSATITVTNATYTKVGRQVFVAAYITADLSTHNVVGACEIGGLPFTASTNEMGGGNSPYCQWFTTDLATTSVHFRPLGSRIRLQKGSSSSSFVAGDLETSAAPIMMLNATYIA
jgi:hypothetical protein